MMCDYGESEKMAEERENTSFGPVKEVEAGVLDVGYVEVAPSDGPPVMLLHGWPFDIHSYAEVAPALAAAGCRVVVPHLRGHGTTRFVSDAATRNGQQERSRSTRLP
jgi:pimeloyl-ACP methyl ester carboxylesterase